MARINLLPHREEKRRERKSLFIRLSLVSAVAAGLLGFSGYLVLGEMLSSQESRNKQIKDASVKLDKEIAEIKDLESQISALLSRKKVIESLQASRVESVKLLNDILKKIPEGVYLKQIKQLGRAVSLNGYAQSNARVSTFMANFEDALVLEKPQLIETKSALVLGGRRAVEFTFLVNLMTADKEDLAKKGSK